MVNNQTYYPDPTLLPQYGNYLLPAGSILKLLINGKNSCRFSFMANYDTRLNHINSMLKIKTGYVFENPQTGIDFKLYRNYRHTGQFSINLTTNFSSRFRGEFRNGIEYCQFENHDGFSEKSIREKGEVKIRWDFLKRAYLISSYNLEYFNSDVSSLSIEEHKLDASIGWRLFKDQSGTLSFNAYDILKRTKNNTTTVNDQFVSNTRRPLDSNYFTLNFEYRFNNTK